MNPLSRPGVTSVAALCGVLLLSSCSVFQASRKMDMSPFSQNAITMFTEAAKVSSPYQWKELKKYTTLPELLDIRTQAAPIFSGLKGIVFYSNQLVALNGAQMKDKEKNQRLAEYLQQVGERAIQRGTLDSIGITRGGFDSILVSIRSAETFLNGIEEASPFIDAIVISMSDRLETISQLLPRAAAAIDREIDADQAVQRRNYLEFRDLQARYHLAIAFLYRARMGEAGAMDSLLQVDPSMKEYFKPGSPVASKTWQEAEDAITERLSRIHGFFLQLESERKSYVAKQQELQEWRTGVDEKIKIARDALMVWAQSHRNLGQGIPVPPIIDVTGIAGGLAKKVLPVP